MSSSNQYNGNQPNTNNYRSPIEANFEQAYLFGWGNNQYGQLVLPNESGSQKPKSPNLSVYGNGIVDIAAGENHTIMVNENGNILSCGSNNYGQLGRDQESDFEPPFQIPIFRDIKIQFLTCGPEHSFALSSNGQVYSWGLNLKGQLGLGHTDNQFKPALVFSFLPNNKGIQPKFTNSRSNTFLNNEPEQSRERDSSIDDIIKQLDQLKKGGNLPAGEKNRRGDEDKFGMNQNIFNIQTVLFSEQKVVSISCGALHTVALTNQGRLFSCGYGDTYALGHGNTTSLNQFEQITTFEQKQKSNNNNSIPIQNVEQIDMIACGLSHSACLINGQVYVWGICGSKEILHFKRPTMINVQNESLGIKEEKSTSSQTQFINIQLGQFMTVALSQRGQVYMMGENSDCHLVQSSSTNTTSYQPLCSENLIKVKNLPLMSQISCGRNHVIAVTSDNQGIYGWGNNQFGQVTGSLQSGIAVIHPRLLEFKNFQPIKVVCGSFHTLVICQQDPSGIDIQILEQIETKQHPVEQQKQMNKEEMEQYRNMIETLKENNEAYKILQIDLLQKNDLMQVEIEKLKAELEKAKGDIQKYQAQIDLKSKQADQMTQTIALQQNQDVLMRNNQAGGGGGGSSSIVDKDILMVQQGAPPQNMKSSQVPSSPIPNKKFEINGGNFTSDQVNQHRVFNSNLEIDFATQIKIQSKISEGGYGIIYQAKWRETVVAVKKFQIDGMNENGLRDFLSECHAMEALRHPNIAMFIGVCTQPPDFCIILQYCAKGALWNILQNTQSQLHWEMRRRLALDAARGVLYLHECQPPILHRDLKSLNLLVDENLRCQLADFGWTRPLSEEYMTGKIGTYQWMAPEVIAGKKNYSIKADVFSFGIILWEFASREPPYKTLSGLQVSAEVFNNDLRPVIPQQTPEPFARLMKRCWDKDPEIRPDFREIIKQLQTMSLII